MNRPICAVHCKGKKHQNILRLLQKTVSKKHSLKRHHSVNDVNNHILTFSSAHDLFAKNLLNWPRPYFTGKYLPLFINMLKPIYYYSLINYKCNYFVTFCYCFCKVFKFSSKL